MGLFSAAGAYLLPGRRCPRRGRMWNAGDNVICGTYSDLLKSNILVGLVLRTKLEISTRIPHQSRLTP